MALTSGFREEAKEEGRWIRLGPTNCFFLLYSEAYYLATVSLEKWEGLDIPGYRARGSSGHRTPYLILFCSLMNLVRNAYLGCRVIIYVDCFLFLITLNCNNSCMCCVRSTIVIDDYNLNSVLLSGFLVFCTGNQVGCLLMI